MAVRRRATRGTLAAGAVGAVLVLAACSGGDGGGGAPGEDELREAVESSTRAILDARAADAYEFFSERCREQLPLDEFAGQVLLAAGFLEALAGTSLDDVEITDVTIEDLTAASALAGPVLDLPDESFSGDDELQQWIVEDGEWRLDDDCEPGGFGTGDTDDGADGSGDDASGPTGVGERGQPVPVGEPAVVAGEWEVTVLEFEPDATEAVLAGTDFAAEPPDGERYATVRVRVTYVGDESGEPAFDLDLQLVDDTAVGHDAGADCAWANDPLPPNELYTGGTAEGNVCFSVPASATSFELNVGTWFGDGRWWFALP